VDAKGYLAREVHKDSFMPNPAPPKDIGGWCGRWEFEEHHIINKELHLSGHHDGLIDKQRMAEFLDGVPFSSDKPTELVLLEIKSTDDNGLRKIKDGGAKALIEEYKCQATLYQRSMGFKETLFFYIERKYFGMYTFTYKGEDKYWDFVEEKSKTIFGGMEDKKLPEKHIECSFAKSKRAKSCIFKDFCFCDEAEMVFELMDE